jgi:metal-responsive CopG/Arc/MetJ family transcriptional regulator
MSEAIGIRFDQDFLKKIDKISKEEVLDRSSTIRKLTYLGYKNMIKKNAAKNYIKGKITLSEAAHRAELTIWEMEKYLVKEGFKSSYSIEDLEKELELLAD